MATMIQQNNLCTVKFSRSKSEVKTLTLFVILALLRAVLNLIPVSAPLFTPLKLAFAPLTDFWRKAVLGLSFHSLILT